MDLYQEAINGKPLVDEPHQDGGPRLHHYLLSISFHLLRVWLSLKTRTSPI